MERKLNIVYLINRIDRGGPGQVLFNLVCGLNKNKYTPIIVTLFDENDEDAVTDFQKEKIRIIKYKFPGRVQFLLTGFQKLQKLLYEKADIVHSHGLIPDIALARMNLPCKCVSTVHCMPDIDYFYEYGKYKGALLAIVHENALKHLDYAAGCSRYICDELKFKCRNLICVRNGIDVRKRGDAERCKMDIPEDAVVFIYAGRLIMRKNVIKLIKLFKNYHKENEFLLIAGEGPDMQACIREADDNVKFLGYLAEAVSYMSISDVYISASSAEGFSISILEAMGCGLMLFLSDIKPHREIFHIQKELYLGECFTERTFEKKINKIRSRLPDFDRGSVQSFQKQHFSACSMAHKYEQIYRAF